VWQVLRVETVARSDHEQYLDRSVSEIAELWGTDPLDAFLDLSLAEDLATQFVLAAPPNATRRAATETIVADPLVMAGSSDGGAHLLSFCGADFTTRLLTEWVPDLLTFEAAVARLTSAPAATQGLTHRGTLAPGMAADVLLIDREQLGTPDTPRYVRDFPANSGRYVCDASGYTAVIVNGEVLLRDGVHTGATPGRILRGT
jgi:N-acyl-D-aspartate/D-glutamate deacylase